MAVRLALVSGNFQPARCGVAHYVVRLAEELVSRDAEPLILTTSAAARERRPARPDGELSPVGVPVVGAVAGWDLRHLPQLVRAVLRARPDVVHIQYAPSSFEHSRTIALAPPLLRALRIPVVVTVHEYGGWDVRPPLLPGRVAAGLGSLGEARGWWDREALLLVTGSDRVVVTNAAHRGLIAERLRTLDGALRAIPIGPNVRVSPEPPAVARRRVRAELGLREEDPLVCFFGFIHPVKGIDTLLRAFARLRADRPTARLLLVGGFTSLALHEPEAERYWKQVQGLIGELGLGGAVVLTGFLPDHEVSARLRAADVCALPFKYGATLKSGSLLAALAHGVPTVATRGELPAPTLVHGEHIWLVPPRQPEALAAALGGVLSDPTLQVRLRTGALALAATHNWAAIAQQHLALYDELVPTR